MSSRLFQTSRNPETHPLTFRVRDDRAPVGLEEYQDTQGYEGVRHMLRDLSPDDLIARMKEANLRGRGGGGFSAGMKWSLTMKGEGVPRGYIVCNADEMEPGTFKDRLLMEELPHLLIEGMIIAGYANNARLGYIFLRGEYVEAAHQIERALQEARAAGILGPKVCGFDFDFDIYLHTGAGRYICGEETALINSLEGRRANPRSKPPFPGQSGAWGKPTVVNNVETLCNAPGIVLRGADWYQSLSGERSNDGGTKIYGVSGKVKNAGLVELPMGATAREVIDMAGGMRDGLELKAWLPGGGSTGFLLPEHLDLAMDFDTIGKAGSRMGTGLLAVIADNQSIVSLTRNLEDFFARESCGWCTPCRDGLPWTARILRSLEKGEGENGDIEMLESLASDLGPGKTFCAHAPGAAMPLQTALKHFRAEFEAGISHPKREAHAEPIPVGSV
ncbi:NADH-quinone oxidoreductase subunit NuoF [Kushneria phosphatilytica]|uniref:NADH-quinone oxidoreductase subunit F n=1 Tax=Kushneria phosphatilytica TaxID=657387 RepID=A0A5C0ZVB0_9GAMM|nr:NADH-quinone oxidoreductase subunit NuoF [Kushneria phosphatilytica]QEL09784.1 NADH-quinone oxidoreductase subunit NuoF [Kushneria phosphatilytica]